MLRKLVLGTGLFLVGGHLLFGSTVGSYVRTAAARVQHFCQGKVPMEFEIARARTMVADLAPDIRETLTAIAQEEVSIHRLEKEIASTRDNLEGERVALLTLREQLSKGLASYKIGGRSYSQETLQSELHRRFTSYKRIDETLKSKEELLGLRQGALQAAREKYDALLASQRELGDELASLEARHKMIEAHKAANEFSIDDSQLSQARQMINSLQDRLQVEANVAEQEGKLLKQIPLDDIPPADLGEQIDSYFHTPAATHTTSI